MCGACVCVYQLLNWKMHGETLKLFNICLPFVNNNLKSLRIVRLKNIYCCLILLVWINTESMLRQKYEMHATGGYSSWRCSCVSSSSCSSLFLLFLLFLFFLSSCSSPPCPQALQCILYLGFPYNLPPFLMDSDHCVPVVYCPSRNLKHLFHCEFVLFSQQACFFAWFGCQLNHQTSLPWQGRDIVEGIGGFYCL